MTDKKTKNGFRLWHAFAGAAALLIIIFCAFTATRAWSYKQTQTASELTEEESAQLAQLLLSAYPLEHQVIKKLPYNIGQPQLDIWAKSAILIDVSNGYVL